MMLRCLGQYATLGFLASLHRRFLASLLLLGQIAWAIPVHAQDGPSTHPAKAVLTQGPRIDQAAPDVEAPNLDPSFSDSPGDEEFLRTRVLEEPLAPTAGEADPEENQALAQALLAFTNRTDSESVAPILGFLELYPRSRWRASLLLNLGLFYRWTGYLSRALDAWEEVWALARDEEGADIRALVDRALAELAALNARLGREDRLERIFSAEARGRDVGGPAAEALAAAREGLAFMRERPDRAFLCGPLALHRIRTSESPDKTMHPRIREARSTRKGTSLAQVRELASDLGMDYQVARRAPGASVILPAVVHGRSATSGR